MGMNGFGGFSGTRRSAAGATGAFQLNAAVALHRVWSLRGRLRAAPNHLIGDSPVALRIPDASRGKQNRKTLDHPPL